MQYVYLFLLERTRAQEKVQEHHIKLRKQQENFANNHQAMPSYDNDGVILTFQPKRAGTYCASRIKGYLQKSTWKIIFRFAQFFSSQKTAFIYLFLCSGRRVKYKSYAVTRFHEDTNNDEREDVPYVYLTPCSSCNTSA